MKRNTLFWGGVLIVVGMILLLDNLGLFGGVNVWGIVWPVLIILFGLWVLFGVVLRQRQVSEHAEIPLEGTGRARLRLQYAAGRLRVAGGAPPGMLLEGECEGGVEIERQRSGDELEARLSLPPQFFPFWLGMTRPLSWNIQLSGEVPLALVVESGANETTLNLEEVPVSELVLKTGASSTQVTTPASAGRTDMRVEAGAASVMISIPPGVGARIRSQSGLSSIQVDRERFPRAGDEYRSADFDTAENKIDIDLRLGVGSVSIR